MPVLRLIARPVLLCALLLLGACSSLGGHDPLRIDLAGIEPLAGQGMEARFTVKLRIQNPNDRAIHYNGIALDLQINGQPLASGVSDTSGEVPRFGESVISVPVTVSALSIARQIFGAIGYQPGQDVSYRISGKLAGSGLLGTHRFSDKGTLKWPAQIPYQPLP